ncbi:MAG: amino acid adenylation domain-containing protein [Bacteroidota bacterium]
MAEKNLSEAKSALLKKWLQGEVNDTTKTIPRRTSKSPASLSFPQQRQLFLELLERGTAVNNLSVLLDIKGKLVHDALENSANQIIARHDALRTYFSFNEGLPVPEVFDDCPISIPIVDLQYLEVEVRDSSARQLAENEVLQPFDLTQVPLIRIRLYLLSEEHFYLLITVHHTIADGWSLGVFLRELMLLYQNTNNGTSLPLPELPIQYADFANWQSDIKRQHVLQSSMKYWKEKLSGELPVLELPNDYQRGSRQSFSGGTYRFELSSNLTEALENFSSKEDVTLFMTLLTAFNILLYRYSGQDDILIGTPVANRNLPEIENLIGVFINTIVLRTNLTGDTGFRELLRKVREVSLGAYSHQDLPFEKLVEALKPQRDLSLTPVFQVVFNMQNSPMPRLNIPGIEINFLDIDRGVSQFDLTLMISKLEGQCHATVEYNCDLYKKTTVARMFQSFKMMLEAVITNPDQLISDLQIITKGELNHIVYGLNQTQINFPNEKCFHQLFEEQAELTPGAVAVIHNNNSLTYLELNQRANVLARQLMALGILPETRVGILMEKTFETVIALLAILKAGGTYVPIQTSFPKERILFILKDANVKVLLTNVDSGLLDNDKIHVVNLNEAKFSTTDYSNPQTNINSNNLAYNIYTSGSTGHPKAVMVSHSALVNFLWSMRQRPGINKDDILLSVTPISFDIAALELFLPLIVGATIVIADKEMVSNPVFIGEAIKNYGVTVMQATPATWQLLIDTNWKGESGLKALCGGEALTRKLANQLLERVDNLWNMYGPTETTIWSSVNQIQRVDAPITIGNPIGNTQIYILDSHLQPVPIGIVGELHIGGEGLARGYLNLDLLTGEKFIPDCFNIKPGARLYKTGDRARYLPDYSIEILGRKDDQVKLNGNRIELGEIAAVLMHHPSVREAIAITRTETNGNKRIEAYCVTKNGTVPDENGLKDFISKKLPGYMVPSVIVYLDSLPLTSNGKIDRKSLIMPDRVRQHPGYVAPQNNLEKILVSIWQNVLGVDQIGINDNFFDLGGASIQSLEMVAKANISGLPISVEDIFMYQTIARLADHINEASQ